MKRRPVFDIVLHQGPGQHRLVWSLAAVALSAVVAAGGLGVLPDTPPASAQTLCLTGSPQIFSKDCMVFNSNRADNRFEIYAVKVNPSLDASTLGRLTNDPSYDSWFARVSPDRTKILFHRIPQGLYGNIDNNLDKVTVWVMNADGSNPQLVQRPADWVAYGHAHWVERDGKTQMLLAGATSSTGWRVYTLDYTTPGAAPIQVTDHYSIDPSWSPKDPNNILYISCQNPPTQSPWCSSTSQELYRGPVSGASVASRTRLSTNSATDHDPYLSNLGDRVAWIQQTNLFENFGLGRWNIWIMNKNGSGAKNLTRDTEINSVPQWSWSPDDNWIYFHRIRVPQDNVWGIYRISPGGGSIKSVLVDGFSNEHPSL